MSSPLEGGESSPPTPESNFREHDDAFLQNQARIWLGQVLDQRLDEATNISDLLADGQILYDLYQVIQKLLAEENGTSAQVSEKEFVSSREITEKYPYPKVDLFLRICQILGLADIDLFTSSDVVDKRNTRKVCMCLRSLSKKARLKKLKVPDFDYVTYTVNSPVSMPTDMVENRRRNLERASSPIESYGQDTSKDSRRKHRQGDSVGSTSETSCCQSDASYDGVDDQSNSDVVDFVLGSTKSFSDGASSPLISNQDNVLELENTSSVGDNFKKLGNCQSNDDAGRIGSQRHKPIHLSWEDLEESDGSGLVSAKEKICRLDEFSESNLCMVEDDRDRGKEVAPGVHAKGCYVNGSHKVAVETNGDGGNDLLEPPSVGVGHLSTNGKLGMPCEDEEVSIMSVRTVLERMGHPVSGDGSDDQNVLQEHSNEQNLPVSSTTDVSPCGLRSVGYPPDLAFEGSLKVEDGGHQIYTDCRGASITHDLDKRDHPPVDPMQGHNPQASSAVTSAGSGHGGSNTENVVKVDTKPVNDKNPDLQSKPGKGKKMMSLMIKGSGTAAALVGLVLFYLQLRKKSGLGLKDEKNSETKKILNAIAENRSSNTVRERKQANHVYPSDRLQFLN